MYYIGLLLYDIIDAALCVTILSRFLYEVY